MLGLGQGLGSDAGVDLGVVAVIMGGASRFMPAHVGMNARQRLKGVQ
jgi:hypothetical protein